MLFVGNSSFGNFAAYDGPKESRLNFRIARAGEVVYFGLGRAYRSNGFPESFGQFEFRVRSSVDDRIVFGPYSVNSSNENLTTFAQAELGPGVLVEGGYPTDERSIFVAPDAGEYYVEFSQVTSRQARYIGLWDITVARNGEMQHGRVYSRNWAFRVPELAPELPYCDFGGELSTEFYSYTSDGFVTKIDFKDSGFQPLSFNLALNRTGPGATGDLLTDRQSIPETNVTANVAEHLIFLEAPDPHLFPDGVCGTASTGDYLNCQEDGTFCVPVTVTVAGQVQLTLDFDGNGKYDEATDRLLAYNFTEGSNLEACVPWDGLLADGSHPTRGGSVDILVEYTQGVQHWALYDGELLSNGICVEPVRPICGAGGAALLHYDDVNIPEAPGNGAPKRVLEGCECHTDNCRTWTNFVTNAEEDCSIDNSETSGYGDRNTLNTWWYAYSSSRSSLGVPLEIARIIGPDMHCPNDEVEVELVYASSRPLSTIRWSGPSGPLPALNDQATPRLSASGTYTALVTDEQGCTTTATYELMDVGCTLMSTVLSVTCNDNGTESDPSDDTYVVELQVNGDNSEGFVVDGQRYAYGAIITTDPMPINGGDYVFTATDQMYACCTKQVVVPAPMPCSEGCAITTGVILGTECFDPGTPMDPTDDSFTFDIQLDGINLGRAWVTDRGQTGTYGDVSTFGPFLISDGVVRLNFQDTDDDNCSFNTIVQAPMACSDACKLTPELIDIWCDDQQTAFDTSDDTYSFALSVSAINARTAAYSIGDGKVYFYDDTVTVGPYPMAKANYQFTIADVSGNGCAETFTLDRYPVGCEEQCGITITDSRIVCNDGGTMSTADDTYEVQVMVSNQNPDAMGWYSGGVLYTQHDEFVTVASMRPGAVNMNLTVAEMGNMSCTDFLTVSAPELVVDCPEDVSTTTHLVGLQTFMDSLTEQSSFLPGRQELCWADSAVLTNERRYYDRITLARRSAATQELGLFSFYLFGPENAQLRGAVFSQRGEEAPDCCQLTNDGVVRAVPRNASSLPMLPDSLVPGGLTLQQRFSVVLRPQQEYSLTTTSLQPGQLGDYYWHIVSADQDTLDLRQINGGHILNKITATPVIFELLNHELTPFYGELASTDAFGLPEVTGMCGDFTIAFRDDSLRTCDRAQISRTFDLVLMDTLLEAVCQQQIDFRALQIADVSWPENMLRFGCRDTFPRLENGNPSPAFTGYPYVYRSGEAVELSVLDTDNLRTSFEDVEVVRTDDGGTNILRSWLVEDRCRNLRQTYVQTIKLENNGLPFFSCPISNHYCPIVEEDIMLWALDHDRCLGDIEVPQPELNNICDPANWSFVTEILRLESDGDTSLFRRLEMTDERILRDVPPADYLLRFIGEHPFEVIEDRYCRIRVADVSEPVMLCRQNTNISLPGSGISEVPIRVINLYSYDNCGIDTLQIRRYRQDSLGWEAWNDAFIRFDCEDVGRVHTVEVRGVDASGNANYCTGLIRIIDNTAPYCIGLETQRVSCDSLPLNFNFRDTMALRLRFGMPEVIDNCSARALELSPVITGDGCTPERVRRRFLALDQNGNESAGIFTQDVYVTPSRNYAIRFPMDTDTDCTDFTDTVRIIGGGCDSITLAFVDVFLPTEGEECRYVQRNYVVTNWCEWDGVSPPIRVLRDEDCNGTEGDTDIWLVRNADGVFVDVDSLYDNSLPPANTVCDLMNPEGHLRNATVPATGRYVYSQRFKVFDTVGPDVQLTMVDTICVDTVFCRIPVSVGIEVADACQVDEGMIAVGIDFNSNGTIEATSTDMGTFTGTFPSYTYTARLPIGIHRYVVSVTDDCGNTTTLERSVRVNDCYVPYLFARSDKIYNLARLMEEGDIDGDGVVEEAAALVEAADLARCDFMDCSGQLTYSVNRIGEMPDVSQTSIYLDCEDRYQLNLEVYVWDQADNPFALQPDGSRGGANWRRRVVRVRLQDPDLACNACRVDESITINGQVRTVNGTPVEAVSVMTDSIATVTDNAGSYELSGRTHTVYALRATKDTDLRAGLSTIDLVILQRHLLGIQEIDNPFLRLAADVNRDGYLDAGDLITLRALILARQEMYPQGEPWRFVDADWDGTGTPPETITLPGMMDCASGHDFVGIRIGDLNMSLGAGAGARVGPDSEAKRQGALLEIVDESFFTGDDITITVRLNGRGQYLGGQLGLVWQREALALNIEVGGANVTSHKVQHFPQDQQILLSWDEQSQEETILQLSFKAKAGGKVSDFISLVPRKEFVNEVYSTGLAAIPLTINWVGFSEQIVEIIGSEDERQNYLLGAFPNPVLGFAKIGFVTNASQTVDFVMTNLAGRRLVSRQIAATDGEQWIDVDCSNLPGGVYLYTLTTKSGPLTGRIVRQ